MSAVPAEDVDAKTSVEESQVEFLFMFCCDSMSLTTQSAMWLYWHLRWLITLAFFQFVYKHVHVRLVSLASDGRSLRFHHCVGLKRTKDQKLSPGLLLLTVHFADTWAFLAPKLIDLFDVQNGAYTKCRFLVLIHCGAFRRESAHFQGTNQTTSAGIVISIFVCTEHSLDSRRTSSRKMCC